MDAGGKMLLGQKAGNFACAPREVIFRGPRDSGECVRLAPHCSIMPLPSLQASSCASVRITAATQEDIVPIYKAPVDEVLFLLNDVFPIARYNNLPGFADASPDVLERSWARRRNSAS